MSLYLDIETDFHGSITVIGFYERSVGLVQLVRPKITHRRLIQSLPPAAGKLFTFNGHCFDLPIIRKQLGVDLEVWYTSVDLRYVCASVGLTGGQKAIERALGLGRDHPDLNGLKAIYLWSRYEKYGNQQALAMLLAYNREDVMNMRHIRAELRRAGALR